MTRVLIVDDDPVHLHLTAEVAKRAGFTPVTATGGVEGLRILRQEPGIGAMVLDLVMPDLDGMAVMETMAREGLKTPVIVQTSNSSLETVVTAMRQGAADFFVKPVAPERLVISLRNALKLEALETVVRNDRHRKTGTFTSADIVTHSPTMDRVRTLIAKAAKSPIPVLVEGEAGTGKELVARAVQGMGDRAGKPFVTINCAAVPANLIDSTLFGHRRGAFPGAVADQAGKFTEAHGGTLFLDEVGALPPATQERLLRAIQHGEIVPLGAERIERVNVRVISATNHRLLNLAKTGEFREDLYYRLNVFPIYVPPLRERRDDIAVLAAHFIARLAAETGRRVIGIAPPALDLLQRYDWPGNVRQLENAIYRAVLLCDGTYLEPGDFPQIVAQLAGRDEALRAAETTPALSAPVHIDQVQAIEARHVPAAHSDRFLTETGEVAGLAAIEKSLIAFALEHYSGRMSRVARALGIGRSTLYRKLKEYDLDVSAESDAA
ncbi:MAG TPA: sigma-54 dependent transcriptional regulator [Devosiaceae bacterium]|jgi:DNA-binding NtrC family response regulator